MCCFSVTRPAGLLARLFAPKLEVSRTNIFARMVAPGRQALAYAMTLETAREVAMVLPLPVAPGAGEDAVTFVDLSAAPRMFDELAALFAEPSRRGGPPRSADVELAVHQVGSFVASYVPSRADFARLDPRFRLPDALFDAVPAYADHGFAVFQLAPGKVTLHPMAFVFPTRAPARLFFPTVHLHDGRFRPTAGFDHALYYQREGEPGDGDGDGDAVSWGRPATSYEGLVATDRPVARRTLRGELPNADTWIATAAP